MGGRPVPPGAKGHALTTYNGQLGTLTYEAEVTPGSNGLAVTRVTVTTPPPTGITHRGLKCVPLAEILRAARAELALGICGPVEIPHTRGRTELTDELLRAVALAYIEETGPGKDRRAIQRMAKRFDRPEGTLRTWISRARKAGWLAPGSKGRIGAEPGPKLLGDGLPAGARRARITRQHLAEVADVYRRSIARGLAPTVAVARHFDVPHRTATRWVGLCRTPRYGLLPPTTQGCVGIEP